MFMSLRYRLALDLGPSAVGWAVLVLNDTNQVKAFVAAGSRIFPDGRNPKDGSSLAVTRRLARALRRRRDRLLHRKGKLLDALVRYRSEEHPSELQSLMPISYAVFCLKTNNNKINLLPTH